jgi:hypothetical protein
MKDWKQSLDQQLMSGPSDTGRSFTEYVDQIYDQINDEIFEKNELYFQESNGPCDQLLNRMFDKGVPPKQAAWIFNRIKK